MSLIDNCYDFSNEIIKTIQRKNTDYASPETSGNPYFNFDTTALIEGRTAQEVLAGELVKKVIRLANLVKRSAAVVEEPRRDTLRDIIGYALILESLDKDEAAQRAQSEQLTLDLGLNEIKGNSLDANAVYAERQLFSTEVETEALPKNLSAFLKERLITS